MYTERKIGWYLYGRCQNCHEPKKERKAGFCRACFWSPEKRFFCQVEKTETCWNWTGPKHPFGYGLMRFRKQTTGTHRASWIMENGKIPANMSVLHKCDNPACVNPEHLFLGTQTDNMHDRSAKLRQPFGESVVWAKLSEENVKKIRASYVPYSHEFGQNALAKMFKVTQSAIWSVLNKRSWKHI